MTNVYDVRSCKHDLYISSRVNDVFGFHHSMNDDYIIYPFTTLRKYEPG